MRIQIIAPGTKSPETPPAEYQTDTLETSNGTISNTPEAIDANAKMNARALQALREQTQRENAKHTGKICPFNKDSETMNECTRDCALFIDDSCALTAYTAERDTKGLFCPFMRHCTPSCAAYKKGCTIKNKGQQAGKKVK